MTELPAERAIQLRDLFRVGVDVTIVTSSHPEPLRGTVVEHTEHGAMLVRINGMRSYLSWEALHAANTIVGDQAHAALAAGLTS